MNPSQTVRPKTVKTRTTRSAAIRIAFRPNGGPGTCRAWVARTLRLADRLDMLMAVYLRLASLISFEAASRIPRTEPGWPPVLRRIASALELWQMLRARQRNPNTRILP